MLQGSPQKINLQCPPANLALQLGHPVLLHLLLPGSDKSALAQLLRLAMSVIQIDGVYFQYPR
jgi:hypothetical protein